MNEELTKEFDKVSEEYYEKFGDSYPLMIMDERSIAEHIQIMKDCIQSGTPAEDPEYEEGSDY